MPLGRRQALVLCLAASLSAHAMLLIGGWGSARDQAGFAAPLAVRTVAAPADATRVMTESAALAPSALPALAAEGLPPLPRMEAVPPLPPPPPPPPLPSLATAGQDGYIPRPQLTVPPAMAGPLILSWPEGGIAGHYAAIVALYIDEEGSVRRIQFQDDALPEPFRVQVRQALEGMRFAPGELHGRPVKSLIRIEVTFDAEPQAQSRGMLR